MLTLFYFVTRILFYFFATPEFVQTQLLTLNTQHHTSSRIGSLMVRDHCLESPSMVDPQWDIWYWGSKWNLHTVCQSAVGCEWGTTSVYFGITYVSFIPSRLPVFAVEPQYLLQDFFIFVKSIIWRTHTSCERLPFEVFFICLCDGRLGIAYANTLVITQWPLERAAHLTSLVWVCVLWLPESLMDLSALCRLQMLYRLQPLQWGHMSFVTSQITNSPAAFPTVWSTVNEIIKETDCWSFMRVIRQWQVTLLRK